MFEYRHNLPEPNEVQDKLTKLSEEWSILDVSYDFLNNKLDEYKNSWGLDIGEYSFLYQQMYYHKKLAKIQTNYLKDKGDLSEYSKRNIEFFSKMCWNSEITESELSTLQRKIEEWKWRMEDTHLLQEDTFRDIVENNIHIHNWPESIYEWKTISLFYKEFTILYLNLLEVKYGNNYNEINNTKSFNKWLDISEWEAKEIIKQIILKFKNEFKWLNWPITIDFNWKSVEFSWKKIRGELDGERKAQDEERAYRESMKKVELRIKEQNEINEQNKVLLKKIIIAKNKCKEIQASVSDSTHTKWTETPRGFKRKFIKSLIQTWSLTKDEVLEIVQEDEWYSELEFNIWFEDVVKLKKLIVNKDNKKIAKNRAKKLLKKLVENLSQIHKITKEVQNQWWIKEWIWDIEKHIADDLLKQNGISVDEILKFSEYETFDSQWNWVTRFKQFNYLQFIEKYWLPNETRIFLERMLGDKMTWENINIKWEKITLTEDYLFTHEKEIIKNLAIFNEIIIGIECDWKNVANLNGWKAKWLFQFHTWNWKETIDKSQHEFNSYEVILRKAYKYYAWISDSNEDQLAIMPWPNGKLKRIKDVNPELELNDVPEWIIEAYNTKWSSPINLPAIKQNELFLISAFRNNKKDENWITAREYIWRAMLWHMDGIEKYYKLFHHTAVDEATKARIIKYVEKYRYKLSVLFWAREIKRKITGWKQIKTPKVPIRIKPKKKKMKKI